MTPYDEVALALDREIEDAIARGLTKKLRRLIKQRSELEKTDVMAELVRRTHEGALNGR